VFRELDAPNTNVNAEVDLKELGVADIIETVIDAPDLADTKEERSPLDPLSQLDSIIQKLNSAETLPKAAPRHKRVYRTNVELGGAIEHLCTFLYIKSNQ